jgi:hypothetical protein
MALPGGYPNLLAGGDADRVAKSYGRNVPDCMTSYADGTHFGRGDAG